MAEPNEQALTLSDFAHALNVSTRTVLRWIDAEKVASFRLPGGQLRITRAELDRLTNTEVPA